MSAAASARPCSRAHCGRTAAHQTVPHVHLHVLPRYDGDVLAFAAGMFGKPLQMLRGGASRTVLEQQAAAIRAALAVLDGAPS